MVQKILIHRTATPNNPPSGLSQGELSVEMADPLRLWVGVPTSIDPSGKRLLTAPAVLVGDTPPAAPSLNQLWWESDTGVLFLWYNDGNSTQWVEVSRAGNDLNIPPPPASAIPIVPGGSLSADDVQEALIELDTEKVAKAGDTMTGPLNLSADPTADAQASNKHYVDVQISAVNTALGGKVPEAPNDGQTYGRKNLAWTPIVVVVNASGVAFTPFGNVAATNVQTAIQEVDAEKVAKAGDTMTGNLTLGDGTAAASPYARFAGTLGVGNIRQSGNYLELSGGAIGTPIQIDNAGHIIISSPGNPSEAANKAYVDAVASGKLSDAPSDGSLYGRQNAAWAKAVKLSGDTMTGLLVLSANPTAPLGAATKQYVDSAVSGGGGGYVLKTGDTMTGDLTISKIGPGLTLDRTDATNAVIRGRKGGLNRWLIWPGDASAESGGNAGSDFFIYRSDDTGATIDAPLKIARASGLSTFSGDVTLTKASPQLTLNKTDAGAGATRLYFQRNGLYRWAIIPGDVTAESGGNTGSDFRITRFDDSGAAIDYPILIARSTGIITTNSLVSYAAAQALTDAQQAQARSNIYAAPFDAMQNSNLLVNGSFLVSQELYNNPINGVSGAPYLVDGWAVGAQAGTRTWNAARSDFTGSPLLGTYIYALSLTCASGGGAAYATADVNQFFAKVEQSRVRRLQWGGANAQPITITFWASGTASGLATMTVRNQAANRSYCATFAISSTPTFFSITVPGDTSGAWVVGDNTIGMYISFAYSGGTQYRTSTLNAWQAGNFLLSSSAPDFFAANGNVVYLWGVQAYAGSYGPPQVKQPLLMRPYADDLFDCQRYFDKSYNPADPIGAATLAGVAGGIAYAAGSIGGGFSFRREMCKAPTITLYAPSNGQAGVWDAPGGVNTAAATPNAIGLRGWGYNACSGLTPGNWYYGHWKADARL